MVWFLLLLKRHFFLLGNLLRLFTYPKTSFTLNRLYNTIYRHWLPLKSLLKKQLISEERGYRFIALIRVIMIFELFQEIVLGSSTDRPRLKANKTIWRWQQSTLEGFRINLHFNKDNCSVYELARLGRYIQGSLICI